MPTHVMTGSSTGMTGKTVTMATRSATDAETDTSTAVSAAEMPGGMVMVRMPSTTGSGNITVGRTGITATSDTAGITGTTAIVGTINPVSSFAGTCTDQPPERQSGNVS